MSLKHSSTSDHRPQPGSGQAALSRLEHRHRHRQDHPLQRRHNRHLPHLLAKVGATK